MTARACPLDSGLLTEHSGPLERNVFTPRSWNLGTTALTLHKVRQGEEETKPCQSEPCVSKIGWDELLKTMDSETSPNLERIISDFFPRLFSCCPYFRPFFNPSHQFAKEPAQHKAMVNFIVVYFASPDKEAKIVDYVEMISHKHCGLNVQPRDYIPFTKVLVASMWHILQETATLEMLYNFNDALELIAEELIETEKQTYEIAAARSGGWEGVQEFTVSSIRHVTSDAKEFTFKKLNDSTPIDFTPGQFLTVHLEVNGKIVTPRHYSVTNVPGKPYLQCCVKRIPDGFVSSTMHKLKVGEIVGLAPPFGTFKMKEGPAVLISAGIGFTSVKSLLESYPAQVKLLLHVDKSEESHPFRDDILACGVKTHFVYTNASGRPDAKTLIEEVLQPYLTECDFYLCAPCGLQSIMKHELEASGAKSVNINVFGPALEALNTLPQFDAIKRNVSNMRECIGTSDKRVCTPCANQPASCSMQ